MNNKVRKYVCKKCGKVFYYDERPFKLKAEKGESRPKRCEECRQSHGEERGKVKIGYFHSLEEDFLASEFAFSQDGYTFHGTQELCEETKEADWSEKEFGITDEDVLMFYEKLEHNQVVIVVAPTGSGKSTFIPYRLLVPPEEYKGDLIERLVRQGQIMITQPLTSAVDRIPKVIAENLLGSLVGPGQIVGLRHGSQSGSQEGEQYDRWNLLGVVTDGSLRNWIRDGKLNRYSLIMVDEAHQRSCNIETILMLLKNELARYPNLKVVISSATVNAEWFRDTFREIGAKADILNLDVVSKRKHKYYVHFWKDVQLVEGCDCWLCKNSGKRKSFWGSEKDALRKFELPEVITCLVVKILKETKEGSILVFLHGETPIEDTAKRIREAKRKIDPSNKIPVFSVYRRIGEKEVNRLFDLKGEKRRVLVTTNIAETSHTLDDVVYVIDSGYIKETEWDPDNQISTLLSKRHSQDGCRQRWGRAGRTQDGYVFCLYTEDEFKEFEAHTLSEVTRSSLDEVMLTLSASGITDVETIPWLVKPEDFKESKDKEKWQKELQRANSAVIEDQFIGRDGLLKEKVLEIFHVPRSASDIDILAAADEYNCAFETAMTLFLMATRDGEPRTGANLYAQGLGLLLWEPNWVASTKMRVWLLHQGLKIGCRDDLDFTIKLAHCFLRAEEKRIAQEWAEYYQVNYQRVKEALDSARDVVKIHYRSKIQEEERNLDIGILERVRRVLIVVWQNKVVEIKAGTSVAYPVVSPQCAGNWQKKVKALVATAFEKEVVIDGYSQKVPTASFMVSLSSQTSKKDLFTDQRFPIGSWVEVKEENGKTYLGNLIEGPSPIKISFKKNIWSSNEEPKREKIISFDQRFITNGSQGVFSQGIWFSQKKANRARIVEWIEQDGVPVAILSSFTESDISKLGKVKGDFLKVKIHHVVRDPIGKNGWASARTPRFEIPIELNELSLSDCGFGLERIEGQTLPLVIKDFDADGFPQLSNLEKVTEDLRNIRKEISESKDKTRDSQRPYIQISGFVAGIKEDKAVVVVPRENGIFHSFEIAQDYVPGSSLKNLRVNEEILLRFFQTDIVEISTDNLTDKEIKNRPKKWAIKKEKNKLLVPPCLEDKDLENWSVGLEAIDFVKRCSWQYCLQTRIISSESLERKKKKEQEEFVERVQSNIERWQNNIRKARRNIAGNQAKLKTSRSKKWEDIFKTWIEEDEKKIRAWLYKIESAKNKLN